MSNEPYQVDTQQHTPLRDRIAAALKEAHSELHFSLADTWDSKCLRLADAVIRELDEAGYAIVNRAESQAAIARLIGEHSR